MKLFNSKYKDTHTAKACQEFCLMSYPVFN